MKKCFFIKLYKQGVQQVFCLFKKQNLPFYCSEHELGYCLLDCCTCYTTLCIEQYFLLKQQLYLYFYIFVIFSQQLKSKHNFCLHKQSCLVCKNFLRQRNKSTFVLSTSYCWPSFHFQNLLQATYLFYIQTKVVATFILI